MHDEFARVEIDNTEDDEPHEGEPEQHHLGHMQHPPREPTRRWWKKERVDVEKREGQQQDRAVEIDDGQGIVGAERIDAGGQEAQAGENGEGREPPVDPVGRDL